MDVQWVYHGMHSSKHTSAALLILCFVCWVVRIDLSGFIVEEQDHHHQAVVPRNKENDPHEELIIVLTNSSRRNDFSTEDSSAATISLDPHVTPPEEAIHSVQNDANEASALQLQRVDNRNATVLDCWLEVEKPLMDLQNTWNNRTKHPILHSMVQVNGTYKVVFITFFIKAAYDDWTEHSNWTCNGVHTPSSNSRMSSQAVNSKCIFVVDCPLDVENITVTSTVSPFRTETYDTRMLRQCSDFDVLKGLPPPSAQEEEEPLHTVVGCTMIRHTHKELREWLVYHRLIGYDHFLIYVNEPFNMTLLPQASYVTYIPWNYGFRYRYNGVPHQVAQIHDCILRARARNVTWLALHDVDEYIQVLDDDPKGGTIEGLDTILQSHENDTDLGALQLPSWFFGENNDNSSFESSSPSSSLLIDRVWRNPTPYGRDRRRAGGREKMFIRPHQVQYAAAHKILVGGPMKDEPRLRLNHYKWADGGGVYGRRSGANAPLFDDSLQSQFGSMMREALNMSGT